MAPDLSDVQFSSAVTEMLPFSSVNDDIQLKGLVGLIFPQSHKHTDTKRHVQDRESPACKCEGACGTSPEEVKTSLTHKILVSRLGKKGNGARRPMPEDAALGMPPAGLQP